jgi:hypothetical protein
MDWISTVQYTAFTGPVAAIETITVDKWETQAPTRPPDLIRAAALASVVIAAPIVVPDVTDPPPVRAWAIFPDTIAPRGALRSAAQLVTVTDPTTPAVAAVPLAGSLTSYPDRLWSLPRAPVYPAFVAPDELSPPLSNTPTGQDGTTEGIPGLRLIQYQAFTGPPNRLTIPIPDFWYPTYPAAIDRLPWPTTRVPHTVLPIVVPDVTDPTPPLAWRPIAPDALDRTRRILSHPVITAPLHPLPDSPPAWEMWAGVYHHPALDRLRLVTAPTVVEPLVLADITATTPPLSWQPAYPDRIDRRAFLSPEQITTVGSLETPPVLLAAVAYYPAQIPRLRPHAAFAPAWVMDQFAAPTPASVPQGVAAYYPASLDRLSSIGLRTMFQYYFGVEIEVPVMSWTGRYAPPVRPRQTRQLPQSVAPLYLADLTVVAPSLSWQGRYPDQIARTPKLRDYPAWTADRFDPPTPISVPLLLVPTMPAQIALRTAGATLQRAFFGRELEDTQIVQWFERATPPLSPALPWRPPPHVVAPLVVPDITAAAPELSWSPIYPEAIRRRPAIVLGLDLAAPLVVPDVTVTVSALSWQPRYPDRHVYQRPAEFLATATSWQIADVTAAVPALSWKPAYPDTIARRPSAHAAVPTGVWFPATIAPPPLGQLTWFPLQPDVVRPRPRALPGAPPVEWIFFLPPVPDVLASLTFAPTYPAWLPARTSPRRWTTERTSATIEPAAAPTAWTPVVTDRTPRPPPRAALHPAFFQPPPGQALVVAAQGTWRAVYPAQFPRAWRLTAGGIWTVEPTITYAALGCLELAFDHVASTTLTAEALTATTLILEALASPTLIGEDLC